MVMEAPSPQCVGREFVRQYYTLLNRAPLHLHRFYSHNSSFLHGGLDRPGQENKPVVGQQDIHQKIMQLNFRDCHAKIRQVDSHETLSDGVVVQVTGELSNDGQPMRRFMQTFVLAPQSPKKYYVRNDIFRYQDEIFTEDDDVENDNALTDVDSEEQSNSKLASNQLQEEDGVGYYEPEIVRNGSVHVSDNVSKFTQPPPQPSVPSVPPPPPAVSRDMNISPQPELEGESGKSDWDDEEVDEEEDEEEEGVIDRSTEDSPASENLDNLPAVSREPKTYANMVSKNTSSGNVANVPVGSSATSPVASQPANHKFEQPSSTYKPEGLPASLSQTPSFVQPAQQRLSRPRINSGRSGMPTRFEGRDLPARSPDEFDPEKRKPFVHYPDQQQLFVGNLTHSITEDELKQHFMQYGTVLDMRINTKQTQKIGGGKVPNFGFIVFDTPEAVQKVLNSKPIYFNERRLNVEEKKRPKDNRMPSGENRMPTRGGMSARGTGLGGRGGRGGSIGAQGTGRGDNRGGGRGGGGGNYVNRR